MECGTPLAWRDNIPLVSWVLLRGKCRHCGTRISALYPAVELATALLVAACILDFGLSGRFVVATFFCAVLVAVTVTPGTYSIHAVQRPSSESTGAVRFGSLGGRASLRAVEAPSGELHQVVWPSRTFQVEISAAPLGSTNGVDESVLAMPSGRGAW